MVAPPPSKLDQRQILQGVYDEENGRLRTSAEATIVNADIDVALDSTEDNVAIRSSTGVELDIETDGSINTRIKDEAGQAFTDTNYLPIGQSNHDRLNLNANVQVNNTDVSSTNLLPSYQPSVVSTLNSSSTPLGISGTFIGTSEEVKDYASISIIVHTDRDSAMDGLSIEYSVNGTVWNDSDKYTVFANQSRYITVAPEARYFRVVYTNGVSAQTFFYLQVIYHRNYIKPSSHRIKDSINEENDAELTKAVVTGKNPNGGFDNILISGVIDANSTSTPLLANNTWSGGWTNCEQYSTISVIINTDVNSALDGAKLQFSHDGSTLTREVVTTFIGGSNGAYFSIPVEAKYFRIVYINGSVTQTRFIVQSILSKEMTGLASIPVGAKVDDLTSTLITRSIAVGKSTDGQYVNHRSSGISSVNSTSTPLLAGQTFTGQFEDATGYTNVGVTVNTDQDSAINGLKVQYSTDGINVDKDDEFSIGANFGHTFTFGANARYIRVVYTNGSTNQGHLRLQTLYHIAAPKPSSHRIDDSIDGQNDAELSKSVLTGKNPDGQFVNEASSGVVTVASTSIPLGIGGSFQSPYFDTVGFATVMYNLKMDQVGTITIETSDNGVDVVRTTTYPIQANSDFFIAQTAVARYIRIRVNNTSGIAQTYIGLQTIMKITPFSSTALTISTPLTSNAIAVNSRSVLAGQQENGTFSNVGLSNSASVKVAITDRPSEVRNRVKVEAKIFHQTLTTTPTVVHTVTIGKTFYLESMIISAINSANAIGEWRIVDGATDKIGYLLTEKAIGSSAGAASSSPALPEPIPFTTSFSVREVLGDIILSVYIIGYEE